MPLPDALAIVGGVIAATLVIGLLWQRSQGRLSEAAGAALRPAEVGAEVFGERLTLLLLTTRTCGRCPSARRVLTGAAALEPGVVQLDVDLEAHPDIAERFGVLQTPTTIVLDGRGAPLARIAGVPETEPLRAQLTRILETA